MSRAVCLIIRAGGRIVGEGILTQDRACTIHEHCRSDVLDGMKFSFDESERQPVLASNAPRGHHEMAADARVKVAERPWSSA